MAFALAGRYIWDFWTVRDGATTHLFYLNAPKTMAHPDDRHTSAIIGHATSTDLVNWTDLGTTVRPSPAPAWDDGTTWTGCTLKRPDGQWMLFYTGTRAEERSKIQRIGAALSSDLHTWTKVPGNPLLTLDKRWYEGYDLNATGDRPWHDESWRDPWVYPDPSGQGWRMLFTARENHGPALGRGVIGQAASPDLMTWTAEAPFYSCGKFGEMEVPQLFELDGWWYCLFCNAARNQAPSYVPVNGQPRMSGTHYLSSRHPGGPFLMPEDRFLAGDAAFHLYAGRMVPGNDGRPRFMAFVNSTAGGQFGGTLTDPMPMWRLPDGRLRVDARAYGLPVEPDDLAYAPKA